MNQTRILFGVILLLAGVFGYLQWSQQNDLAKERDEQKKLIEALLIAKSGAPQPSTGDKSEQPGAVDGSFSSTYGTAPDSAPGNAGSSNPAAEENPSSPPKAFQSAEEKRLALMEAEIAKMREENEALKLQGQATTEERDRLSSELEVAKYQIDRRMAQIREAPMIGRVTRVIPEHGLIVISAGREVGIEPKDEFSIRRGGKIICNIRVSDSVDEKESAADPVRGSMAPDESVKEGDEVVKMD